MCYNILIIINNTLLMNVYLCTIFYIYYKELVHIMMEAEKSRARGDDGISSSVPLSLKAGEAQCPTLKMVKHRKRILSYSAF